MSWRTIKPNKLLLCARWDTCPKLQLIFLQNEQSHKLTAHWFVLERNLSSPVEGGAAVGGQVPLQLCQGGEIQTALHANVLLAFFMLQLMGSELAGVGEASAAHPAAEWATMCWN